MDVNTKDHSYQFHWKDTPVCPRPVIAASWESNSYESVDVIMELNPNTRVLWTQDHEVNMPPKPIFFQVTMATTLAVSLLTFLWFLTLRTEALLKE